MKLLLILVVFGAAWAENAEENGEVFDPDLFEGDIILLPEQRMAIEFGLDVDGADSRGATRRRHWPNGVVPYTLDPSISSQSRAMAAINAAMKEWSSRTCITFKKRTTESGYVHFFKGSGCSSYVGRIGRKQTINLASGCWRMGTVAHEIAHALGFHHEQSRPDRDNYVTINFQNIRDGYDGNFKKYSASTINSLGTPYDYGSVMHYGGRFFSKNGKPTIVPKDPNANIGQRAGPSATDVQQMNLLYKCSNSGGNGGNGGATSAPCVDTFSSCARYTSYCGWHDFVKKNCKKTCKMC